MVIEGHLPSKQLTPRENEQIRKLHDQLLPMLKESLTTAPTSDTLKEGWGAPYKSGSDKRMYYNVDGEVDYISLRTSSCRIILSGTQTTAAGVPEIIAFDTEDWDLQSEFNTTTYRFTAGATGKYLVCLAVRFGVGADADRIESFIYKNGAEIREWQVQAAGTSGHTVGGCTIINLSADDYLEFYANNQNNNDSLTSGQYTEVSIVKVL